MWRCLPNKARNWQTGVCCGLEDAPREITNLQHEGIDDSDGALACGPELVVLKQLKATWEVDVVYTSYQICAEHVCYGIGQSPIEQDGFGM